MLYLYLKNYLPLFLLKKKKFKVYGTIISNKEFFLNTKFLKKKFCYFVITGLKTDNYFINEKYLNNKIIFFSKNILMKYTL